MLCAYPYSNLTCAVSRRLTKAQLAVRRETVQTLPGPDSIFVLDLVISDKNKKLLLRNPAFVTYLYATIALPVHAHRADIDSCPQSGRLAPRLRAPCG